MTWLLDATSPSANNTAIGNYYAQVQPSNHVPGFLYLNFLPITLMDGSPTLALPPEPEEFPSAYPAPVQSNELPQSPYPYLPSGEHLD
jgi:hypothetical protein